MIHTLVTIYGVATTLGIIVAIVVLRLRKRADRRILAAHVRRDEKGQIYARDPQTGAWHRLEVNPILSSVTVTPKIAISPRQRKRLRGRLQRILTSA